MAPKNRVWTDEAEEFLISFVEARPCLYNPKDKSYHRTFVKNLLFKECAELMGRKFSTAMVKDRWTNLRGTFVNNHRKILMRKKDPNNSFGDGQPTWQLYHRLQFLIGCLHISNRTFSQDLVTNTGDPDDTDSSTEEPPRNAAPTLQHFKKSSSELSTESPTDDHIIYANRSSCHMSSERPNTLPAPPSGATSQNRPDIGKAVVEFLGKGRDDNYHFGMCVAASLRNNMTGLDRERAKSEIQSVLLKYHKDNAKE